MVLSSVARLGGNGVSLTDLAEDTGLSPSTLHRYITVLVETGYLYRAPGTKLLSLGGRAVALGRIEHDPEAAYSKIATALLHLRGATGETSFASQMAGQEVVCIAMERGTNPLHLSVSVGQTIPPIHAASARAVLAFVDPGVAAAAWSMNATTDDGSAEEFIDHLGLIRERGFDICDSEFDRGVFAIAAPVFLAGTGDLFGALTVAGSAERFASTKDRDQAVHLVLTTCLELSARAASSLP